MGTVTLQTILAALFGCSALVGSVYVAWACEAFPYASQRLNVHKVTAALLVIVGWLGVLTLIFLQSS